VVGGRRTADREGKAQGKSNMQKLMDTVNSYPPLPSPLGGEGEDEGEPIREESCKNS